MEFLMEADLSFVYFLLTKKAQFDFFALRFAKHFICQWEIGARFLV